LPHARIMAVEIFRGPDHMAMRMLTAGTVRRQSRVCNGVEDNAFHLCLGGIGFSEDDVSRL